MDRETPKEKLLEACGVKGTAVQSKQEPKHALAMIERAEIALANAQSVKDDTDRMYQRLHTFIHDELPPQLMRLMGKVTEKAVTESLRPLNESANGAARRIESCAEDLARVSWNGRLMMLAVLLGALTVSVGCCMFRFLVLDGMTNEAKRYEVYGRKVEASIERYKPKDKERLYRLVGGRP